MSEAILQYAERTKMCYDAVDRSFCDAIANSIQNLLSPLLKKQMIQKMAVLGHSGFGLI